MGSAGETTDDVERMISENRAREGCERSRGGRRGTGALGVTIDRCSETYCDRGKDLRYKKDVQNKKSR